MNQTAFFNYLLSPEIEAQARRDRLHRLRKGLDAQDIVQHCISIPSIYAPTAVW